VEQGQELSEQRMYQHALREEMMERELGNFLNGLDHQGRTALTTLCARPEATREEALLLLEANADPLQRDYEGNTAFIECAKVGNLTILKMLLQGTRGLVMRDIDDSMRSALHWAAQENQDEVVQVLLQVKADADAVDRDGLTAADLARSAGHEVLAATLAEALSDELLDDFMSRQGMSGMEGQSSRSPGQDSDAGLDDSFDMPQADISEDFDLRGRMHSEDTLPGPGQRRQEESESSAAADNSPGNVAGGTASRSGGLSGLLHNLGMAWSSSGTTQL